MRFSSITNEAELQSHKPAVSATVTSRGSEQTRETSYLNLVAKVKELGLHNTTDVSKSRLIATTSDVTHVGLNAIISIRRNRTLNSAAVAPIASPFGGSVTNLTSSLTTNPKPKMLLQPGVLTKTTSLECLSPLGAKKNARHSMTSSPLVAGAFGGSVQSGSGGFGLDYAVTPPRMRSPASVARNRDRVYASKPATPPTPVTSSCNVDSGTVHSPRKRPTSVLTSATATASSPDACLTATVTSAESPCASPTVTPSSSSQSRVSDVFNRFVRSPLLSARSSFTSSSPKPEQ